METWVCVGFVLINNGGVHSNRDMAVCWVGVEHESVCCKNTLSNNLSPYMYSAYIRLMLFVHFRGICVILLSQEGNRGAAKIILKKRGNIHEEKKKTSQIAIRIMYIL